jgi:hypothetical protein
MMALLFIIAVLLFVIAAKVAPGWTWLLVAVGLGIVFIPVIMGLLIVWLGNAWPVIAFFTVVAAIVTPLMVAHEKYWIPFRKRHATLDKTAKWMDAYSPAVLGAVLIGGCLFVTVLAIVVSQ